MRYDLHIFDKVESTNDLVKDAIRRGEPEGWVACAYAQEAGCGRAGRTWASPEGGLYLSLLLRPRVPHDQLPSLTLCMALAVRQACMAMGVVPQVKWPNDLILGVDDEGRFNKLAGLIAETCDDAICFGIGLNVVRFAQGGMALEGDDRNRVAYVCDQVCATDGRMEVNRARELVLNAVSDIYDRWVDEGFPAFADIYRGALAFNGREVRVANARDGQIVQGTLAGIANDGALLLEAEGSMLPVYAGELLL